MIAIEYKGYHASWSSKSGRWTSTDTDFVELLNRYLPDEEELDTSTPFKTGGLDKLVLDEIKKLFGKALKVIAFFPSPAPEEQEGIDY